jgi:glycosyltransferase involved in cell wall biosynthesis
MKILINTPALNYLGGVSTHYLGLRNFWSERVKYNVVGKRRKKDGSGIYCLPWDILKYIFKLLVFRPNIVLVNPSLGKNALKRDFLFLNIAHFFHFKVAVFIHGFDWEVTKIIDKKWVVKNLNKALLIFVLAQAFKRELISWGVSTPIVLSTTKVDNKLLADFEANSRTGKVKNILFLARVEKNKGIYETIRTFELLKKKYPFLTLTIVGDGSEFAAVKNYVENNNLTSIKMTGRLQRKALTEAFKDADLYLFPSSHGEGMPASVLEAMAFGLPVFTRKVGGLPDYFENGKMGYITDSLEPQDFADAMIPYIEDDTLTKEVSLYNHRYAQTHFLASRVAQSVEEQLRQTYGVFANSQTYNF